MSFSIQLGVSRSYCLPELSFPLSYHKITSSIVTLPSQTIHKTYAALESNFPISTYKEFQIQPLIEVLRDSVEKSSIQHTKAVHGFLLKSEIPNENLTVLLNHVAHAYSKCSDFGAAGQVFDEMSETNIFSWTVMIVGSTENGLFPDGFQFFCEMLNHGILPDKFAYSAIMQTCIGLGSVKLAKMVHAHTVIRGFLSNEFVSTSLLNMYAKLGMIEDSSQVFNAMEEPNDVSWNAMVSGFTANGLYLEAFKYFRRMKNEGNTINEYTIVSVSKAVGKLGDIIKGQEVHCIASELGMESNVQVGTALIDMYAKCGSLWDARSVFDLNFSNCGVNTPWNAMISAYLQNGFSQEALVLYVKMRMKDIKSDLYTFCSVLNAISTLKCLKFGKEVHGMVLKSGHEVKSISVFNAIADAYSKCGALEDARKTFDRMEEHDVVSWTTLVTAFTQSSEWEEALNVFSQMREEGFTPNHFTFSSVLVSCASLCFLEYGRQVHALLCKSNLHRDKCTDSALIDMYAKCGSITDAMKVFEKIPNPDTVSWTAIISGYAQHGLTNDALLLFREMEQLGVMPNSVTFLCVLFACSHGGMVEEGLHYFQLMEKKYGLEPEMEHYACIIDLLGRLGRLDDAMEFIKRMPVEPNEMVWQSLLAGCRVHGNVELGKIAAKKVLSAKPEYSATYVLLSNIYIETGNHKDGVSLRDVMRNRGVKKEPGCSWIFVEGRMHKFYSRDQQHPLTHDIYTKLDELERKVKSMGYVPNTNFVV